MRVPSTTITGRGIDESGGSKGRRRPLQRWWTVEGVGLLKYSTLQRTGVVFHLDLQSFQEVVTPTLNHLSQGLRHRRTPHSDSVSSVLRNLLGVTSPGTTGVVGCQ